MLRRLLTCNRPLDHSSGLFGVQVKSPEERVQSGLRYKRDDLTWKTLSKFWQEDPRSKTRRIHD